MKNILLFVIVVTLVKYSISLSEVIIVSEDITTNNTSTTNYVTITNNIVTTNYVTITNTITTINNITTTNDITATNNIITIDYTSDTNDIKFLAGEFDGLFFDDKLKAFNTEPVMLLYTKVEDKLTLDLIFNNDSYIYFITLSDEERKLLLTAIVKYKQWNKIAIDNQAEVDKKIDAFDIASVFWRLQNQNSGYMGTNIGMHMKFFSQAKERHQLVIYFDEVVSDRNQFITTSVPTLYLDNDEILKLEELLKDSYINSVLQAELEKKKAIDILFN